MHFDFETIIDRHGKNALAVDGLGTVPKFTPAPSENNFEALSENRVRKINFLGK